jgi:ABC-2 type transport system permease protein
MAVYKRTYKGYSGALTAAWSRFLILPRYSFGRLFQSKFLVLFLMACFFYPAGCAVFIYLSHNLSFLRVLNVQAANLLEINANFFYIYCTVQATMAYLLTALVGPGLVSPDLVNNALPLYFCRPFSRSEYVAGKMSVLIYLLSLITWIPGLILFLMQSSLAGRSWIFANWWIAEAIVVGSLVWIGVLSLIAMAMSAWVKWRIAAGALILGVIFVGAGFGRALNAVMRIRGGAMLDLAQDSFTIWSALFRLPGVGQDIDTLDAVNAIAAACLICLWLLFKKVRPFEVVK